MNTRALRATLVPLLVALGAAGASFGPALRPGHTLQGGDLVLWVPQFIRTFHEGLYFPRWFPHYYAGLAQQFQFLSHAALTMLLVPPFYFHAAQFALDVAIASLGMWALGRSWKLRPAACAIGALAYPLSNHLLTWAQAGHLWKYDTTCWTPWLILALGRAHATGMLRWYAAAGAAFGLHLLGGDVQLAYYVALIAMCWTVGSMMLRCRKLWRERAGGVGRLLGRHLIGCLVAVMTAGTFGAEVIQHYVHVFRTQSVVAGGESEDAWRFATEFSLPPEETAVLAFGGGVFGHDLDGAHYWGRAIARFTDDYVGIVAACFALCALAVRRGIRAWTCGTLAILGLMLAWGKYVPFVYKSVYALPLMHALRNPNRWLFVTALAVALLAALGADTWLASREDALVRDRMSRVVVWTAALAGVLLVASLLFAMNGEAWHQRLSPFLGGAQSPPGETALRFLTLRNSVWRAAFLLTAWAACSGGWLLAAEAWGSVGRGLVAAAMVFLVGADLVTHARPYIRTYDARAIYQQTPLIDRLQAPPLGGRVKLWSSNPRLHELVTNLLPYFGIGTVDVISSRRPPAYSEILRAWRENEVESEKVLWLFQVTTLLSPGPLPETAPPHRLLDAFDGIHVNALRRPAQRGTIIADFNVLEADAILPTLLNERFDPRQQVLLSERPPLRLAHRPGRVRSDATLVRASPHLMEFNVSASEPALLVVHDLYDPYWVATVEGKPETVLEAYGFLRAVPIPEGRDMTVTLAYRPPRWPWLLTLLGWCGLLAALLVMAGQALRHARPVEGTVAA